MHSDSEPVPIFHSDRGSNEFAPGDDFYSSNAPDLESEKLLEGKCRTCRQQAEKFDVLLEGRFFPAILLPP